MDGNFIQQQQQNGNESETLSVLRDENVYC